MHADHAITIVFTNLKIQDDYRLEWLRKTVKNSIRDISKKVSHQDGKNSNVEYIIEPIIHIFDNYKGLNTMAINMGYNFFYESKYDNEWFDFSFNLNKQLIANVNFLISSEYGGIIYCFGACADNPYVSHQKSKDVYGGMLVQLYGNEPSDGKPKDQFFYSWFAQGEIDSSIIYSIFPKEKITLPKIE